MEDDPTSVQARYLLGLCYFFTQDYGNAVSTLQPLAEVEWNDLNFLYVLAISGWQAKQPELEQRTMARLIEIGARQPPGVSLVDGQGAFKPRRVRRRD